VEDEELAALESAAYQRELELDYLEREELGKISWEIIREETWQATEGAF
jgi:hypothetical protein